MRTRHICRSLLSYWKQNLSPFSTKFSTKLHKLFSDVLRDLLVCNIWSAKIRRIIAIFRTWDDFKRKFNFSLSTVARFLPHLRYFAFTAKNYHTSGINSGNHDCCHLFILTRNYCDSSSDCNASCNIYCYHNSSKNNAITSLYDVQTAIQKCEKMQAKPCEKLNLKSNIPISEMNDIREELRRVKRELRQLKDAILQLPPPVELRNDIVTHCTSIMHLVEFCDKLRITIDFFYVSNATYGEKERDAKNVELTIENYKTHLNFHFHHLRLLYASAPLLVATRAISSHAWEAMMGHPQKYTMRDGITKKTLLTFQSEIQLIVQDQQQALEEMFAKMRDIRTNVLQKKRAQKDSTQGKILLKLECLNALVSTLRKS